MTKRKTIREKKVAIIQMLVGSMWKHLEQMNIHLKEYDGELLNAFLDSHFESIRCSSGNLSLVLENDRQALAIMFESVELDKKIAKVKESMQTKSI